MRNFPENGFLFQRFCGCKIHQKITKNNSQRIIFAIISCQRVVLKEPRGWIRHGRISLLIGRPESQSPQTLEISILGPLE